MLGAGGILGLRRPAAARDRSPLGHELFGERGVERLVDRRLLRRTRLPLADHVVRRAP